MKKKGTTKETIKKEVNEHLGNLILCLFSSFFTFSHFLCYSFNIMIFKIESILTAEVKINYVNSRLTATATEN